MKKVILITNLCFWVFSGCTNNPGRNGLQNLAGIKDSTQYAKGFSITHEDDCTRLEVRNPWQQANNVLFTYYLVSRDHNVSETLKNKPVIKTPVQRVICMSTTHIAFIDCLNETKTIFGISGKSLVNNNQIQKNLKSGRVFDVGYEESLNYELIAKLKPDVVFFYGVNSAVSEAIGKLKEMGIQVVLIGEYLEIHPLAKAEWLKFFSYFFEKENEANRIFNSIATRYDSLHEKIKKIKSKPGVMLGLPFHGTWYVSGGESYIAKLIGDAGGNYIWNDLKSSESLPLDLETIIVKSTKADFWLNIGEANSKKDIISVDSRLSVIKPFISGNLYNNNALQNNSGGNDYWESGVVNPDVILNDLIAIFHPELCKDYQLHYYKKIE